jgi:transcriptional regulator with XRE-family HTH domain
MTFGEKLRELREAKGLSRMALADACGVPFGTIHGYESGRRAPAFATTLKLAKALGVDCTAFADCEDLADEEKEPATTKKGKGKK